MQVIILRTYDRAQQRKENAQNMQLAHETSQNELNLLDELDDL